MSRYRYSRGRYIGTGNNLTQAEREDIQNIVRSILDRLEVPCPVDEDYVFGFCYPKSKLDVMLKAYETDKRLVKLDDSTYNVLVPFTASPRLLALQEEHGIHARHINLQLRPRVGTLRPDLGYADCLKFNPGASEKDAEPVFDYVAKSLKWSRERNLMLTNLEVMLSLLGTKGQVVKLMPTVASQVSYLSNEEPSRTLPRKILSQLDNPDEAETMQKRLKQIARLQSYMTTLIMMPPRETRRILDPGGVEFTGTRA